MCLCVTIFSGVLSDLTKCYNVFRHGDKVYCSTRLCPNSELGVCYDTGGITMVVFNENIREISISPISGRVSSDGSLRTWFSRIVDPVNDSYRSAELSSENAEDDSSEDESAVVPPSNIEEDPIEIDDKSTVDSPSEESNVEVDTIEIYDESTGAVLVETTTSPLIDLDSIDFADLVPADFSDCVDEFCYDIDQIL